MLQFFQPSISQQARLNIFLLAKISITLLALVAILQSTINSLQFTPRQIIALGFIFSIWMARSTTNFPEIFLANAIIYLSFSINHYNLYILEIALLPIITLLLKRNEHQKKSVIFYFICLFFAINLMLQQHYLDEGSVIKTKWIMPAAMMIIFLPTVINVEFGRLYANLKYSELVAILPVLYGTFYWLLKNIQINYAVQIVFIFAAIFAAIMVVIHRSRKEALYHNFISTILLTFTNSANTTTENNLVFFGYINILIVSIFWIINEKARHILSENNTIKTNLYINQIISFIAILSFLATIIHSYHALSENSLDAIEFIFLLGTATILWRMIYSFIFNLKAMFKMHIIENIITNKTLLIICISAVVLFLKKEQHYFKLILVFTISAGIYPLTHKKENELFSYIKKPLLKCKIVATEYATNINKKIKKINPLRGFSAKISIYLLAPIVTFVRKNYRQIEDINLIIGSSFCLLSFIIILLMKYL